MARMGRPRWQLTTKGGVLEVYMGHYMREWLAEQGMVKSGECPPPYTVYAYADSLQMLNRCDRTSSINRRIPGV